MNKKEVYTFAKFQVKEGNIEAVLSLFAQAAAGTATEQGNLFYNIHQSNTDPNTIMLYEGYIDQAAVDAHRSSEHFQTVVLQQIVPLLDNREVVLTSKLDLI